MVNFMGQNNNMKIDISERKIALVPSRRHFSELIKLANGLFTFIEMSLEELYMAGIMSSENHVTIITYSDLEEISINALRMLDESGYVFVYIKQDYGYLS